MIPEKNREKSEFKKTAKKRTEYAFLQEKNTIKYNTIYFKSIDNNNNPTSNEKRET